MPYYLSYVEVGIHAAFLVSHQKRVDEPAEVVTEAGFTYAPNYTRKNVGFFKRLKGHIAVEESTGYALYSKNTVKHRTYEVSESELTAFYQLINADRRRKVSSIKIGDNKDGTPIMEDIGGPDYQIIQHNCKTYAMGIFKKIGIVEAGRLNTGLIQITKVTPHLLQNLTGHILECKVKDDFLRNYDAIAVQFKKHIHAVNKMDKANRLNPFLTDDDRKTLLAVLKNIQWLNQNKKKVGFNEDFFKNFSKLCEQRGTLVEIIEKLTLTGVTKPETNQALRSMSMNLTESERILAELTLTITDIETQYKGPGLCYNWKSGFKVSKRVNFSSFTDFEKAVFSTKVKSNSVLDGLNLMGSLLEHKSIQRHKDQKLMADLEELRDIVDAAKIQAQGAHRLFADELISRDDMEVAQACLRHQMALARITNDFSTQVCGFNPRSKRTNLFMILINFILDFFRSESDKLIQNPIAVLRQKANKLTVAVDAALAPSFKAKKQLGSAPKSSQLKESATGLDDASETDLLTPPKGRPPA